MEYLRKVDQGSLEAAVDRHRQVLLGRDSGATTCQIKVIKTPPEGGSPLGKHEHDHDQMHYVLSGTMTFDIGGTVYDAAPGTLVVIPTGTPHRNWNRGTVPAVTFGVDVPLTQRA